MRIYTLTNRLNGKIYVGATTISMARRLGGHRQDAEKGKKTLIAQAIREHGWENFDVAVIGRADSLESMLAMESDAMKRLNTLTPDGYNRSSFGSNAWKFTQAERDRISVATQGRKPWNLGISTGPMPEATKEKQRQSHAGQKAWNRGVSHTAESKLRMREAHSAIEHHYNERAVEVDGVTYPSLVAARRATGLTKMQLRYRLKLGRASYAAKGT